MRCRLQESIAALRRAGAPVICVVLLIAGAASSAVPARGETSRAAGAIATTGTATTGSNAMAEPDSRPEPPPSGVHASNDRVSAQLSAVPVGEVVTQLADATGLEVVWLDSERGEPISATFQDLALEEAVGRLLRQRNHVLEMPVDIERRSGRQVPRPRLWIGSMVVAKQTTGAGAGARPGGQVAFSGPQGPQVPPAPPGHQGAGLPRQMDVAAMPAAEQAAAHAAAMAAAAAQQQAAAAAAQQQQAGGGDPTHAGMPNPGVGFVPSMAGNDAGYQVNGVPVAHGGPGGTNASGGSGGPGGPGGFQPGDRPDHPAAGADPRAGFAPGAHGGPGGAGDFVDDGAMDDSEE